MDKIGKSSANGSVPKSGKASSDKVTEKTTDDRLARYVLLSLYDFTRKIVHPKSNDHELLNYKILEEHSV